MKDLPAWLMDKRGRRSVQLPRGSLRPTEARDSLLENLGHFPTGALHELHQRYEVKAAKARDRISLEVSRQTDDIYETMVRNADMLFAIRCPSNAAAMDTAGERYNNLLEHLKESDVISQVDNQTRTRLRMPELLQENMAVLSDAFERDRSHFQDLLDATANGSPLNAGSARRGGLWESMKGAVKRFLSSDGKISKGFRYAMEHRQTRMQRIWLDTVEQIMPKLQSAMRGQRIYQSGCDRQKQFYRDEEEIKDEAFDTLRQLLLKGGDHKLSLKISQFRFTQDCSAVKIKWSEEVEKDPREVLRMYQLGGADPIQVSLLGDMEFEPGAELRELATVKTCQVIAILVEEGTTIVRRLQFPLQLESEEEVEAEASDVRTFPRVCSMCSIRASDRRVVFTFGADVGRLGSAVFCRFNESFTSVEAMRSIDLDATFSLTAPFADILLTERSLCVMDENGNMQSFDIRTRQTSKRTSFEDNKSKVSGWQGGLLSFADELVIGRASINDSKQLRVDSISSEDHRQLPSVIVRDEASSEDIAVGCMDDVLYVVDGGKGVVFAAELNVTVRSEAYRIQQSGMSAKSSRSKSLHADSSDTENEHWLRVFYHVFEKFPARSLVDVAVKPGIQTSVDLGIAVTPALNSQDQIAENEVVALCKDYFTKLMQDLRRLNKPLSGLDLTKTITSSNAFESRSVRRVVMAVISFVPVQICRAEDNMLKLLHNGEDILNISRADASSESSDSGGTEASEIAQSIRFGLLSPLLESWSGRCAVVTSMGKQSTGKSYFLNHLAGTSFAISGSRCTDGAWMSLRFVTADVLLVVLDFEGLGSFERSEQEDIFLSVLNASVSLFTVFRMESRFDKDIDGLFSRFQKGVQLIKNDPRLFRGLLYMSVKDVNSNDRRGVYSELGAKLNAIFKSSREQNFLTEMYAGNLRISCAPPFGTMEYYQSMERDTATNLLKIVAPFEKAAEGFVTGKAFLDCIRVVLAKISILDWTSMDKSTHNLLVTDARQKLPGILRTGCLVSKSLVADPIIPSHLKEDVLRVGSREKIVVSAKEVFEAYPGFVAKWTSLIHAVALDGIEDSDIDLGFDVSVLDGRRGGHVHKTMNVLFRQFLGMQGKEYGKARLTTDHQNSFDAFVAFVLRRRKMKVASWLRSMLSDRLSDVRSQLEQRYADPLLVYLSRCQHRCARCQLGCMHSVTHSPEVEHNCCTDHKCRGQCEYGECCADSDSKQAPPCSRSAGHEGKCECEKGEHTCGQTCVLARASNCDKTCSKRADHSGDHRCSVQVHVCGAKCSADTCNATCLLDIQRKHSVHKCAEVQCLHTCFMEGCKNTCGEKDHFHGQGAESRTFASESGMTPVTNFGEGVAAVTHLCAGSHACPETCQIDGICEQKVHLKKSARTYAGARGTFEYIYQEMNGCKKQCAYVLPSGDKDHAGCDHSCLAQSGHGEDGEQIMVHYCDVRCPSCNYYCNKHFGHMGLHATSHGNMRQTYFMAKTNDIDIEDRKYQVGERGIAEMCNLFCSKMGRGHTHYLPCESKDGEKCVYTGDASEDHRRHCVDELFPPPGRDMDELLHAQFWSTIGWEDPCNDEERAEFAKCRFQCNAPEHDGSDGTPSFCVLGAWHKPELKPEDGDDGFSYVDGHKFECVHAVDTGKFHNIFVLDSSGSMSGQPWQDLLCACSEFGISRLKDGGEDDLVSYVTFDDESHIFREGERLPDALQMTVPFYGGGTSFEEGLRAANEVLSRNDFEEFKAVLIFFSDGQPWDIELGFAMAQHIRSTYAKYDLKAFVVGFGYVNLPVLQRVASEMGGEYRQVLDANALRTEFQRIAAVLCNNEASLALVESDMESS